MWYKCLVKKMDFVYVDQSGFDKNTYRDYGWSKRGEIIQEEIDAMASRERSSIVAGCINNKLIAPMIFNGTCNRELMKTWLIQELIPVLNNPSVIILDNASIHKGEEIKTIIENAGHKILFLPPYSPHLNPIEKMWANIKKAWRYSIHKSIYDFMHNSMYLMN
jgi:transposase